VIAPCPACTDGACLICRADWHELAARLNPTEQDARELMRATKLRRMAMAAAPILAAGCRASVETADGFMIMGVGCAVIAAFAVTPRWWAWLLASVVLFMLGALVALGGWA
jgi:hypothetical protein